MLLGVPTFVHDIQSGWSGRLPFFLLHFLLRYSLGNVLFTKLIWYILLFMILPNVFFLFFNSICHERCFRDG